MVTRAEKAEALEELARHRARVGLADDACWMCALASGQTHPGPIRETEHALVVLDRFAARPGHLLIVLREHHENVTQLGVELYLHLQRLAFDATRVLESELGPTRVYIAALGAPNAVTMSFPHVHLHVIPLFERDESTRPARVFSWTDGVVLYDDEEAHELATRLRATWERLDAECGRALS